MKFVTVDNLWVGGWVRRWARRYWCMRPPVLTSCPPWQISTFFSFLLNKYQLNHNLNFCCLIIYVDSIIRHCDQTNIFKTFNKNRKWMTISCKVWWFIYVMHEGRGHKWENDSTSYLNSPLSKKWTYKFDIITQVTWDRYEYSEIWNNILAFFFIQIDKNQGSGTLDSPCTNKIIIWSP